MKHLLFFALISFSSLLPAQVPEILQDLEGDWYRDSRQQPVFVRWFFADAHTLKNFTYTLLCKDTVLLSRAEIRFDQQTARMTVWADTVQQGQAQNYRLVRAGADELFWENEQAGQTPARLSWIFFGASYLNFRADGVETDYRRIRGRNTWFQLHLQTGLRWTTRAGFTNRIFPAAFQIKDYHTTPQLEYTLGLGLRGKNSPLGCMFEFGYSKKQIEIHSETQFDGALYVRRANFRYTSFSMGIIPELSFGPDRAITLSAGVYANLRNRSAFDGVTTVSGTDVPNPKLVNFGAGQSQEGGLVLGLAYELPFKGMGALRPGIYTRGTFNVSPSVELTSFSAGLRFALGRTN